MFPFLVVFSRNAHNGAALDVANALAAPTAATITTARAAAGLHPREIIDCSPMSFPEIRANFRLDRCEVNALAARENRPFGQNQAGGL
jgi:hypothetical protein